MIYYLTNINKNAEIQQNLLIFVATSHVNFNLILLKSNKLELKQFFNQLRPSFFSFFLQSSLSGLIPLNGLISGLFLTCNHTLDWFTQVFRQIIKVQLQFQRIFLAIVAFWWCQSFWTGWTVLQWLDINVTDRNSDSQSVRFFISNTDLYNQSIEYFRKKYCNIIQQKKQ